MDIIQTAKAIATAAHANQVRKTDGSPYIKHPEAVATLLVEYGFSNEVVAAGWVHDVLEDTNVTEAELRDQLGDTAVDIFTTVSEDKMLPWEMRKEQYSDAVAAAPEGAKAVSIADKIHNAESLIAYHGMVGKSAWRVFSRGKKEKLWFEELVYAKAAKTWRHPLLDRYRRCIDTMQQLAS